MGHTASESRANLSLYPPMNRLVIGCLHEESALSAGIIGVSYASIGPVQRGAYCASAAQVHRVVDVHLASCAGLVPVVTLTARTGLPALLTEKVCIAEPRIKSGSAKSSPKVTTLIAGICAGADSIDDLDILRSGAMKSSSAVCMHPRPSETCCGS
jgi:hypothetical protein